MITAVTILAPFVLGAFGWFVLEFFARPVRRFFDLRGEIKRKMLLYWSLPQVHTLHPDDREDALKKLETPSNEFEELGAQLVAFDKSETLAAWFVRKLGFEPRRAGKSLRTISIELGTEQEDTLALLVPNS